MIYLLILIRLNCCRDIRSTVIYSCSISNIDYLLTIVSIPVPIQEEYDVVLNGERRRRTINMCLLYSALVLIGITNIFISCTIHYADVSRIL